MMGGGAAQTITTVPTLETARLRLRPFALGDAPAVQRMAGDRRVAETTLAMPHPYLDGIAEGWIGTHAAAAAEGRIYTFAIERRDGGALLGAISITLAPAHRRAEIGYWLGAAHWGRGYMSEAARRVVAFGFGDLGLHRVQATGFPRNPASARVMEKAGMRREGSLRGYVRKGDVHEDVLMYAVLRDDWEKAEDGRRKTEARG